MRDREVALFGEDVGHQEIVGALVKCVARDLGVRVRQDWRSATGGRPRLVGEYRRYLACLPRELGKRPDFIVVATDANCMGLSNREEEITGASETWTGEIVTAIPDPHIERWLLLDGAAFKMVVGRGCQAPDLKCDRDRYKDHLIDAILEAGVTPSFGGIEYASGIVEQMDLQRASQDRSFRRFVESLRQALQAPIERVGETL